MTDKKLNYRILNVLAIVALVFICIHLLEMCWGFLGRVIQLLLPFIIGFVFAYAFTPLVKWLEKKKIKRGIAITIVIVGLVLFIGGLLWITLPLLYDQLSLLLKMVLEVLNNLSLKYNFNLGSYELKIADTINTILKDVGSIVSSSGIDFLNKSIGFIGKFIVGFVAFVYFLIDMDKIRKSIKDTLRTYSKRGYDYFKLMDKEITNYLKGLEIFMVIQFFEYSILFLLVGHPNWLILGILACITTVIPYFGGLITNLIAIVLASVVSTKLMILTILICLIFPQVDGYLISPRIYGKTTNVNPLIVIMAVSIGGSLAGIMGIIAALPVYLFIRTTYNFFKKDLKKGMGIVKRTI
ncbi:MAG: AI-2E family transporter [Bacilli bacterium]|nr:AI-2E family transporter [Bacilli bacterium]